MPELPCPTCSRPVRWDSEARWRPFCSDRCRLIDLGDWLSDKHAIPGEAAGTGDDATGSSAAVGNASGGAQGSHEGSEVAVPRGRRSPAPKSRR